MEIVDLQLHDPAPFLSWDGASEETRRSVVKEVVRQMIDAVGVNAVVLHPAEDLQFAEQLAVEDPGRFASVPIVMGGGPEGHGRLAIDPEAADVEERIAAAFARPGVIAMRFTPSPSFMPEEFGKFKAGVYDRALAACQQQGIPVLLMVSGAPEAARPVAERFPELQIILDHLGLKQPPMEVPDDPLWLRLPEVLSLARYPNVAVKLCGALGLSTEGYPFADVRPQLHRLLEAFGPDRLAWASDIGRFRGRVAWTIRVPGTEDDYPGKHNYMESLAFYLYSTELSQDDKEKILGKTTRRLLKWPALEDKGVAGAAKGVSNAV